MKYIDYTDPYMIEYASFMLSKIFLILSFVIKDFLAKPPNPPQWLRILQPLQKSTWIGIHDDPKPSFDHFAIFSTFCLNTFNNFVLITHQ